MGFEMLIRARDERDRKAQERLANRKQPPTPLHKLQDAGEAAGRLKATGFTSATEGDLVQIAQADFPYGVGVQWDAASIGDQGAMIAEAVSEVLTAYQAENGLAGDGGWDASLVVDRLVGASRFKGQIDQPVIELDTFQARYASLAVPADQDPEALAAGILAFCQTAAEGLAGHLTGEVAAGFEAFVEAAKASHVRRQAKAAETRKAQSEALAKMRAEQRIQNKGNKKGK